MTTNNKTILHPVNTQGITLAHIAALSTNHCIGMDNDLPWHISADLQHFKKLTQGGVMVLGRKTYDSFGGKPLPKRSHWVITRQSHWQSGFLDTANTRVYSTHTIEDAIDNAVIEAKHKGLDTVWIIGGAQVFADTIGLVRRLELTHVHTHIEGDAFYPSIPKDFTITQETPKHDDKSGLDFTFTSYERNLQQGQQAKHNALK